MTAAAKTRKLPLLPLRDIIVFPHMVVPLFVGREKSINALDEAMQADKEILLSAQKKAKTNEPTAEDIFPVGTLGTIIQLLRLPDGTVKVAQYLGCENHHIAAVSTSPHKSDTTTAQVKSTRCLRK